jgi:hypothetical protein
MHFASKHRKRMNEGERLARAPQPSNAIRYRQVTSIAKK